MRRDQTPRGDPAPPGRRGQGAFTDEAPGAHLSEISPGKTTLLWSTGNLVVAAVVVAIGTAGDIGVESEWYTLLRLLWALLPVSAALTLATILWHGLNPYTQSTPGKTTLSLLATVLTFGIWFACRRLLAATPLFGPAPPPA